VRDQGAGARQDETVQSYRAQCHLGDLGLEAL